MSRSRLVILSIVATLINMSMVAAEPKTSAPSSTVPTLSTSVLIGSVGALTSETSSMAPMASIGVEAGITSLDKGPRLAVKLDLSSLPGQSVVPEDPRTWRAIELSFGLRQKLPKPLLFGTYLETGFASRLSGDVEPRVRSAKWLAGGLRFASLEGAELQVGLGADQRLGVSWATVAHLSGRVAVRQGADSKVYVFVQAILGIGHGAGPDLIRAGIAFGK